jgi:hypothetical protein
VQGVGVVTKRGVRDAGNALSMLDEFCALGSACVCVRGVCDDLCLW